MKTTTIIAIALPFAMASAFFAYSANRANVELETVKAELVRQTTYRRPTVSECKRAMDIVKDVAPLFNFEKGEDKNAFIQRIYKLTENPVERMYATYAGTAIFSVLAYANNSKYDSKFVKDSADVISESCNKFELEAK